MRSRAALAELAVKLDKVAATPTGSRWWTAITFLPNEIQSLFVRAFTDGARDPSARPVTAEWRRTPVAVGGDYLGCLKRKAV